MRPDTTTSFEKGIRTALLASLLVSPFSLAQEAHHDLGSHPQETDPPVAAISETVTRQGVSVEFRARPSLGRSTTAREIYAGDYVDLAFSLTDADNGQVLRGQFPGAWIDLTRGWNGETALETTCKERVGTYLQRRIGIRPLIDLNSYFILVMNRDPSISVIDPITGITGITKLYAQINLKRPGADWTKTADENLFFVTMPLAGEVAVVDTDTFKVTDNVKAGMNPVRISRQPDGQYLWVGNDAEDEAASGVTVIETSSLEVTGFVATGRGHHEIAFSDDSRWAFVTNEDDGTVSVVDVRTLAKAGDVAVGGRPVALGFSQLSRALYVSVAEAGEIAVVDAASREVTARIAARPGLGPLRVSQDGRWVVAANTEKHVAYVVDPAVNLLAYTVPVGERPYQVSFSRSFAYVRSLGSERVSMIDLSELGGSEPPPVVTFPVGERPPAAARDTSLADAIVEAPGEAAVMVVSPADNTVYYYMEGMNAPMGNFRNYGHMPRAVQVVDRSMQERDPGVYSSTVRIPDAGTYEVAFLLDSPSIIQCFELTARPNPALEIKGPALAVEFLNEDRRAEVGETVPVRFKLADRKTGRTRADLEDVAVYYFAAPGGVRNRVPARHDGEGVYEADVELSSSGAYYVYVACPSENVEPADLPFMTLRAGVRARG